MSPSGIFMSPSIVGSRTVKATFATAVSGYTYEKHKGWRTCDTKAQIVCKNLSGHLFRGPFLCPPNMHPSLLLVLSFMFSCTLVVLSLTSGSKLSTYPGYPRRRLSGWAAFLTKVQ
jgi:hypothetical protein